MHITRLRISAHNLNIERGRYKGLAIAQRVCKYCQNEMNIDDELHFLNKCKTFLTSRNCFYGKFSAIDPTFKNLSENQKFIRILNPKTPQETKLTNKFIKIMFDWREKIDQGFSITNLGIYFTVQYGKQHCTTPSIAIQVLFRVMPEQYFRQTKKYAY